MYRHNKEISLEKYVEHIRNDALLNFLIIFSLRLIHNLGRSLFYDHQKNRFTKAQIVDCESASYHGSCCQ